MNYEAKNFSHAEWAHSNLEQYRCSDTIYDGDDDNDDGDGDGDDVDVDDGGGGDDLDSTLHLTGSQRLPGHNLRQFARLLLNWSDSSY